MSLDEEFDLTPHLAEEGKPPFPDGIGLSIDYVKSLIANQNEVIVDKDDPMLVTVTILNAFISEQQKVHDKYLLALKNIYSDQVDDFAKEVNKSVEEVRETLKNVSTDGLMQITERQTARITELQTVLRATTIIIGTATLLNVLVMIWS